MKANMGSLDKAIRMALAIIIGILFFTNAISGTIATILLFLAGIFILTSFIGSCPLYQPFGYSSKKRLNSKVDKIKNY